MAVLALAYVWGQKFTDGSTDGRQTDDGRRASALAHWNELTSIFD